MDEENKIGLEEPATGKIIPISIENEMKSAYIDYSMSVIVSRALPDVRDGLKPVHRRVLYGMSGLNLSYGTATKKSARIVGEVLGKYHPHGDNSVYDAMARLAQPWNLRYPLVFGQGNFGSIDGDPVAAMRYTEAKLAKISEDVLADLNKDTVDFQPNFDESDKEPVVLPTKLPLILLNGAAGIAVGMATNMAPHNLSEVCEAVCAYIDNPAITVEELMQHIKGPDFPTGGIIQGIQGIRDAFETGRGKIAIRSKAEIETADNGRETIVITEIPYQVNKAEMIGHIVELVESKRIEGISDVRDLSNREGIRIEIKLKAGSPANVVLNQLYKYSELQANFSVNNVALVDGRPRQLNLRQILKYFVRHRHDVVVRRAQFDLKNALKRAHILEGLLKALDIIDEIINLIRASKTPQEAHDGLMAMFGFSSEQADAIVEMRLRQLTGLERNKLQAEYDQLMELIHHLQAVLASEELQMGIIKDEMRDMIEKYGDSRRTEIALSAEDFNPEDFYADEDVVITISHLGYIKRTSLAEYRLQNRGGMGSKGSTTREEDFIEHIYVANMHSTLMLFTKLGKCFWLKVYEIPEGAKASKGRAIQNVVMGIDNGDSVQAYINLKKIDDAEFVENHYIVLATSNGTIKKTQLSAFTRSYSRTKKTGLIAVNIREGDSLVEARITDGSCDILLGAGNAGKCCRFKEEDARAIGRTGTGVRGINLDEGDAVVGMVTINAADEDADRHSILVVSENGYGKRSLIDEYRITSRGAKGVKTINITEKTGKLVAIKDVTDDNDLMIINCSGITIRVPVSSIRIAGRATQGVKLINIKEGDSIAAVCVVNKSEDSLAAVAAETPKEESSDLAETNNE